MLAQRYDVPVLVQVRDLKTSNDQKKVLEGYLKKSALQLQILKEMNPKVKDVLYTYADFPNMPKYIRAMFEDVPLPFYIIIDKGPKEQPHVHLYPGKACFK